jgi:hypothetical protein
MDGPTSYPEVNLVLVALTDALPAALGPELTAVYLTGSLASGDFDEDSDVDVVVVTANALADEAFAALAAMHQSLRQLDSRWASQLEAVYAPLGTLRGDRLQGVMLPNIERGVGAQLKRSLHDESWLVQCHQLRRSAIPLIGRPAAELVEAVTPADLRQAMLGTLRRTTRRLHDDPSMLVSQGYQSYFVLSLCRILYTLQHGEVASKRAAAMWARDTSHTRWQPLIDRALEGRGRPGDAAPPADRDATLAMFREAASSVLG